MRVFDDTDHVAPRIEHVGHANTFSYILNVRSRTCAEFEQARERWLDVLDAPVGSLRRAFGLTVRRQTELEAADVEADVERLVEIRREPQDLHVPELGRLDVGRVVDRGAQS